MTPQACASKKASGQSGPARPLVPHLFRAVATAALAVAVTLSFSACGKAKTWATRDVKDLTVELPYPLQPSTSGISRLSPGEYALLDYVETFETADGTNPRIWVTRLAAKSVVTLTPDGSMDGDMKERIARFNQVTGHTDTQYSSSSLMIDGVAARKASYTGQAKGENIHLNALYAVKGQKLWTVVVVTTGDSSAGDGARILDSVHIKADAGK